MTVVLLSWCQSKVTRTCDRYLEARHWVQLRAWHPETPNKRLRQPLPGPIQGLGMHDSELCYKYVFGERGETEGRDGAVHSWYRAWRLDTTETDRRTVRPAGQAGQHSGTCNPRLVGVLAGVLSRAPGPEVLCALAAAHGLSSRLSGPGGTPDLIRRMLGRMGAEGGPPGKPESLSPARPTRRSPCGQTRAGRRLPGARQSCSISAASAPPAPASAAARAPGSWCSGAAVAGEEGR